MICLPVGPLIGAVWLEKPSGGWRDVPREVVMFREPAPALPAKIKLRGKDAAACEECSLQTIVIRVDGEQPRDLP